MSRADTRRGPGEKVGRVALVGAGPGAPDLLTLRGAQALQEAEVVVYDALCSPDLLEFAPPDAERVNVGKRGHEAPTCGQAEIQELLIERARAGRRVVRLKGGDPFVFGRGGEEISALRAAGIPVDVIPGVSSAFAVPALAGIPLTDRRHAACFAVVTGHKDPSRPREELRWSELARAADTLVLLMGMRNLAEIVGRLLAAGRSAETPAAAIMDGSLPTQRVVTAPLAELPRRAEEAGLRAPSVIVVGAVVGLRSELGSWEELPLFGRRVLVTRPGPSAGRWARALREAGAVPVVVPTIRIVPVATSPELEAAFSAWDRYDAVLLTSANAARELAARAREHGLDPGRLAVTAHCVGPETAEAAREAGFAVGELPLRGFDAAALAERLLAAGDLGERRYLLPRAAVGRAVLPDALRAAGARVDEVVVYRTEPASFDAGALADRLASGELDAVLLASPSATRSLVHGLGPRREALRRSLLVALGPATAEAIRALGFEVGFQPPHATIDECIQGLARMGAPQDAPGGSR